MDAKIVGDTFDGCHQKDSNGRSPSRASLDKDTAATMYENHQNIDQSHQNGNYKPGKKKKVSKFLGGGLRKFSIQVCKKVESKGKTTHNEVADEIIAEFAAELMKVSLDESDEKNIRRRVYDALNVLMALDIIAKDGKEIWWKGLPKSKAGYMEELKVLRANLMAKIRQKLAYLQDLENQVADLQNLIQRNQQLFQSGSVPSGGFSFPFIVVQTSSQATVEIEISDNEKLVHFDFNSTPFSLHDDALILKLMRCYQRF